MVREYTLTVVLFCHNRWLTPNLLVVPTEKVAAVDSWASILTLVTVLKARFPLTALEASAAKRKASEIVLPSTLVPVMVTTDS